MSRSLVPPALRYLDAVAKYGSVQGAARELRIAASAIDRQVHSLEANLGVTLFDRMPRGMRLTEPGEVLVRLVQGWQAGERQAVAELYRLQGVKRGLVNLFAMDSHATSVLPRLVQDLTRDHPRIGLDIELGSTEAGTAALMSGQADLLVAFNLPSRRDLRLISQTDLPLGCIVAPSHPLAAQSDVTFQQAIAYPLVLQSKALQIRRYLEAEFSWLFADPHGRIETNSLNLVKALAVSGTHLAFTSELDAAPELERGILRFLPVREAGALPQTVTVAVDGGKAISSVTMTVAEYAAEVIATTLQKVREVSTDNHVRRLEPVLPTGSVAQIG